MSKTYRIGTRGSLLAKTQSTQIKELLEEKTGHKFELCLIKTQGDLNTSAPLWQLEGKDFFTKELDEALLKNEIDLVVHSYKDLGSIRPEGIHLAAVTERSFAHDILLVSQKAVDNLSTKEELIIGTSSPRRIYHIENNLIDFIPAKESCQVKTKMLRGNVNTRIQKLRDGEYDGIVLALAGLERLAKTEESRQQLEQLLQGLNFMVLPQSSFPSAASQGALGIECRSNDEELKERLSILEHQVTKEEVARERKSFNGYGGGCHLAVGIHVKNLLDGFLHIHRGTVDHNEVSTYKWENSTTSLPHKQNLFIGLPSNKSVQYDTTQDVLWDELIERLPIEVKQLREASHLYVTSSYCLEALGNNNGNFIWVAGEKTHKKTANQGFWINGSADSFGEDELIKLSKSQTIQILCASADNTWITLSHDRASSQLGEVIPSYKYNLASVSEEFSTKIAACELFYWSSFRQFEQYREIFPSITEKLHACGVGKTYQAFAKHGIEVTPFLTIDHFLEQQGRS